MSEQQNRPAAWQVAVVTLALVAGGAAIGGGAYAKGRYDALNAKRVDGLMAVKATTSAKKRAGRLVATDSSGRVPDSARFAGVTRTAMSTISISPQSAFVSGAAVLSTEGPQLSQAGDSRAYVGFVVPADHSASNPVTMDVLVDVSSATACGIAVTTPGLHGTIGPAGSVGNGGWNLPGTADDTGVLEVPQGSGDLHLYTFTWDGAAPPGAIIHFALMRNGSAAGDTCTSAYAAGFQVHY